MSSRSLRFASVLAFAAALLLWPPAATPQKVGRDPQVDETTAMLNWILGRWSMPVSCAREDGSVVDIETAVVFRPASEDASGRTVRATFFGIDVAGAQRCWNLIETGVPDRRGVIYLTFTSQRRLDLGVTRMRHNLDDGGLSYRVTRGKLRIRDVGAGVEPRTIDFAHKETYLHVSLVKRGSDGDKLLSRFAEKRDPLRRMRRLAIEVSGPDVETATAGYYLEDPERVPGRR